MKLSDVKGERTFDVIAAIIDPISNIASDKAAADLFIRKPLPEGVEPRDFVLRRIEASVPVLLKEHKGDLIAILSAIEGVSVEEYTETLDLMKLAKDTIELLNDEAFKAFFI